MPPRPLLRFAAFEFDPNLQELRRRGLRVRLSASQLRLLTLFLENPGQLLTRQVIEQRIWTETRTIDVQTGINTAINRLRGKLGDDPSSPQCIETVIGLGYRFIASIDEVNLADGAAEPSSEEVTTPPPIPEPTPLPALFEPESAPQRPVFATPAFWFLKPAATIWLAAVIVLVAGLTIGSRVWFAAHRTKHQQAASPLLFTPVTNNRGTNKVTEEAVSPDGTMIAYADDFGISLQTLATGTARALAPMQAMAVHRIDWLPDQTHLLVSGTELSSQNSIVRVVPLDSAYATVMAEDADLATISPDGSTVAFVRHQNAEVWICNAEGQQARRLAPEQDGRTNTFLLWSRDGKRLMVAWNDTASGNKGIQWMNAQTGARVAHEDNLALTSAVLLPDGRMEFIAQGNSVVQLFTVPLAQENGHFLNSPTLAKTLKATSAESLTASRDGHRLGLVLDRGVTQVFLGTLQKGPHGTTIEDVHQLTHGPYDTYPHAWGNDGSVYFETHPATAHVKSNLTIFVQRPGESSPRVFGEAPTDALMAQRSPDGHWILFMAGTSHQYNLYRVPMEGGMPQLVPTNGTVEEFHCARDEQAGCVVRKAIGNQSLVYNALDPVKGIGRELTRMEWEPTRLGDWGLSPDGHTAITTVHDPLHQALRIISLDGSTPSNSTLEFKGPGVPIGAHWTGDRSGLFVESRTDTGYCLSLLDWAGHVEILRTSKTLIWALAAPNGSRIAFPDYTTNSNVWTAELSAGTQSRKSVSVQH